MTRDKQFDLLDSLGSLDDDVLTGYVTARAASGTDGAVLSGGRRARERGASPWMLAACLCLFAALVYAAVLLTAGGGWNRIAGAFGWTRETTQESERETDPRTGETVTDGTTDVPGSDESTTEAEDDTLPESGAVTEAPGTTSGETSGETPGETSGEEPGTDPESSFPSDFTSAHADTSNTGTSHAPRSDFFIGTASEDDRKLQIIGYGNVRQNESFAFYRNAGPYALSKRNLKTHEETPVCRDPYCSHEETTFISGSPEDACPFNYVTAVHFLYENKIYYTRSYGINTDNEGAAAWHDVFASYDYMTGEYHAIEDKTLFYNTRQTNYVTPRHDDYQRFGNFVVYGSAAYSIQYRPLYGKGDSAKDYGRVLVRLDLETDRSTDLMPVDDLLPTDAHILAIRQRVIYLMTTDALWAWTPEKGTVRRITVLDPSVTKWYLSGNYAITDEYLYLMTYHWPDGYDPNPYNVSAGSPMIGLLRVDLKTGEPEPLSDVCPSYVFFTEDAIYIVPEFGYMQRTKYWQLNINPWKESTSVHKKFMSHILKTDLDGKNMETIGYCNADEIDNYLLILTEDGLLGDAGFFEFSTGITYTRSGEIRDDPSNGIIDEPPLPDDQLPPGHYYLGEMTWW